jgi:hypothetical protein
VHLKLRQKIERGYNCPGQQIKKHYDLRLLLLMMMVNGGLAKVLLLFCMKLRGEFSDEMRTFVGSSSELTELIILIIINEVKIKK